MEYQDIVDYDQIFCSKLKHKRSEEAKITTKCIKRQRKEDDEWTVDESAVKKELREDIQLELNMEY
jgi:hypothetical protein